MTKLKIVKLKMTNYRSGYAVLELLFYIAFFAIISLVVINAMITMTRSFRETAIQAELDQSGNILERIGREVKGSYTISSITSTDLKLNAKDDDDVDKTLEFLFSGSNLQLLENGTLIGNLNPPNILVTNVNFTQITTANSKAVKISLTVKSSNDPLNRLQDFYDTIVLRGSYQ